MKDNLIRAQQHSIYYRRLFKEVGFEPSELSDLKGIEKLPITTKTSIRENIDQVVNDNYKSHPHLITHTSGTTGAGLIYPESVSCEQEKWAVWWRFRMNRGIGFATWVAFFGGRTIVPINQSKPPYWRTVKATKRHMFSMYHLNKKTLPAYIDKINHEKISWFHGYPSFLSNLASLMLENGLRFEHKVKKVSIGAENLLESHKRLIKEAFGVSPIQHYGLSEPVANISECEYGNMHVDEDYSFVEFIPIQGQKDQYRIVGSSFSNPAMFFLRYDTNDVATITANHKCQCGRESRIVDRVDGRSEDFVTLRNGTKIGRMDHIFKDMINVVEARIVQEKDGFIHFDVVKSSSYQQNDEESLIQEIRSRLDADYFDIRYVDKIERTSSGKLRFVVSEYEGPA
ncbi:MAG: phenylacetate--CoA ligase family protein [Chitinophagales bacterium]|nr:phenylacetate--CoA ligase family protein [Chitinophagales bacterium]